MTLMSFSKVVDYIKQVWLDAVSFCQENYADFPQDYSAGNGLEAKPYFDVRFAMDSTDFKGAITDEKSDTRKQCRCDAIIRHSDGVRDPSLPIETFAQTITIEMTCPEEHREMLVRVWDKFGDLMKSIATNIDSVACLIKTDNLPKFGEKKANLVIDGMETAEAFVASMDTILVAFQTAILSNDVSLSMSVVSSDDTDTPITDSDGASITGKVNFTQMQFKSTCETRADSHQRTTLRFRQNSRQKIMHLECIATTSTIDTALVSDIENGTYFGKLYLVSKTRSGKTDTDFYTLLDGATTYVYGSLVAFVCDFQPGY